MSGICGAWFSDRGRAAQSVLLMTRQMSQRLESPPKTRTGDAAGVGVAAQFASQQIFNTSRTQIVCDAELYNESELLRLVRCEKATPPHAQTAALLAGLYERFGPGFANKLRGAFSFILWDERERRMIAGIDGFGIKRLVYHDHPKGALVASRIDGVMASGDVDTDINPRAIANVLNFTSNLAPETVFKAVKRLPPGTLLIASEGRLSRERYWDIPYAPATSTKEEDLSRELELLVQGSVARHCKDDSGESLGAFLSGGTDSSTVVGMMSRTGRTPVKAFSIGFEEQPFNELGYAELAAKRFGAQHHTYLVGPRDCFSALPDIIRCFDEPFGNASAVPTYFCARLGSECGSKAILTGDGGDELFGGNERYLTDSVFDFYQKVPRVLRKGIIEPLLAAAHLESGPLGKARRYVRRSNLPPLNRYFSYHFLQAYSAESVFEADFLAGMDGYSVLDIPSAYYGEGGSREHLNRLLNVDMRITLADNDLPKVTCTSELAGIQARFPFLDREVAEFAGRLPVSLKVKGIQKRYLFKRAFRNLLPAEIIQKKKHGFGIPVAVWLKTDQQFRELAHDTLLSSRAMGRGYFRREFIEGLFREHEADESTYFGDTLWTFLTMELWHRQFVDQPTTVTA